MPSFSSQLGGINLGHFQLGLYDQLSPTDNLNNWNDFVNVFISSLAIETSDNLSNWVDDANVVDLFSSVLGEIQLGNFLLGALGNLPGVSLNPSTSLTVVIADSLNNWNDLLLLHLSLITSDNLNNWNDIAGVDFLIFSLNQTINVGSSLATRPGPGNSPPRDAWKDGINYTLAPFADLDIFAEDLEVFLSAYTSLGIGLILSDTLTLSDASIASGSAIVLAFDSMFFNIFDAALAALGYSNINLDTLNNFSDIVSVALFSALGASDSLNLNDNLSLSVTSLPAPSDTLSLSDVLELIVGVRLVFSEDTNNLNDLFINSPISRILTINNSESLVMTDELASEDILLSTSLTSYLRRYLNDVIN